MRDGHHVLGLYPVLLQKTARGAFQLRLSLAEPVDDRRAHVDDDEQRSDEGAVTDEKLRQARQGPGRGEEAGERVVGEDPPLLAAHDQPENNAREGRLEKCGSVAEHYTGDHHVEHEEHDDRVPDAPGKVDEPGEKGEVE